jgi:hypothetical protein
VNFGEQGAMSTPNIQEFKEFLENYNDPNFRKLFEEFTKTMSNPNEQAQFLEEMKKMHQLSHNTTSSESKTLAVPQDKPVSQPLVKKAPKESQDVQYLHGFCIKTSATVYRNYQTIALPVFINVSHSEQIKPAIARKNCSHGHSHSHGHCTEHELPESVQYAPNYWEIPHSTSKRCVSNERR